MAAEITDVRSGGALAPIVAAPVEITRIVTFLDGSPFAERALPTSRWVADRLDAALQLVEVVPSAEEAENALRYLGAAARRHHATGWDALQRAEDDVASVLVETLVHAPGALGCMATHGRDRSAALVGSVAATLLDHNPHPTLLVGPRARPVEAADAPIVAAADGTTNDEAVVAVALGWAARLGRRLLVVTVAEPAPPSYREGVAPRRAVGPDDPEGYLATVAERAAGSGVTLEAQPVYDPVSVRDGLVSVLDRTAALAVVGTHHRHGWARMVAGSHAARIVHDAPVPILAVPTIPVASTLEPVTGGTS
jgi:nucleotide-binding universal stress UspA family protein